MAVWSTVCVTAIAPNHRWDAEYFRPDYMRQAEVMLRRPTLRLEDVAPGISDGNHLSIADDFVEEGVRYLRGQDLADFFISDGDPIHIPERIYRNLKRSHIRAGDVLLVIVGANTGNVGLVTGRHGKLTASCKLAIIRPTTLPAEYVAAYLASRIGHNEIQRRVRGAAQTGLILPDLRDIPIIKPNPSELAAVLSAVKAAEQSRTSAIQMALEAETVLTSAVAFKQVNLSPTLSYSLRFSDLVAAGRFGAEFFMPAKARAIATLCSVSYRPLTEHFDLIKDLWSPDGAAPTDSVRNYDLGDASQMFLDDAIPITTAADVGSVKKRLQPEDVVISRLRSYLKQIAVVGSSRDVPPVGSSEFIVLRPRGSISSEAMLVYLRSNLVQTILKWSQDGTNHPRFDEREIMSLPVPDALISVQKSLKEIVGGAIKKRQEGFASLSRAKAIIEKMTMTAS